MPDLLEIVSAVIAVSLASVFYCGGLRILNDREMDNDDAIPLSALMISIGNSLLVGLLMFLLDTGVLHYTGPILVLIFIISMFIFPWGPLTLLPILTFIRRNLHRGSVTTRGAREVT